MDAHQTGPQEGGLLPAGSVVSLEIYYANVRTHSLDEIESYVIVCEHIQRMQIVRKDHLDQLLAQHNEVLLSEFGVTACAMSFKQTCALESSKLWVLEWKRLLDRKLLATVQLEIQPAKGN